MSRKTGTIVTSDCRLPRYFLPEEDKARQIAKRVGARGGTATVGVLRRDLRKFLPCAESLIRPMFLHVGGKAYQVASYAQASQMFCIARDKNGEGASNTPSPLIVDDAGSVIAHISYNGRVWPGVAWTVDAIPLYDNRMA
jgi:hypothetical protein